MPGQPDSSTRESHNRSQIPEEKTRILRNVISDKLSEEGKTVAIGACVYYKDCALRVDSMREGMVTRVEVIKNL